MIITVEYDNNKYMANLNKPLDLSIPVGDVKCFYAPDVFMKPYTNGDFIGSVSFGAPVNFYNVFLNPHGNGTHTECIGHITKEHESIDDNLKIFHFVARLISVQLEQNEKFDEVITKEEILKQCSKKYTEAIIIRTKPNDSIKRNKDYSGSNPPYLEKEAMEYFAKQGVKHLLIDLPSVDREEDEGLLIGHHIFWGLNLSSKKENNRKDCTITELIYINNQIKDGLYLLNLQIAPLKLDATPSKPVIYKLNKL